MCAQPTSPERSRAEPWAPQVTCAKDHTPNIWYSDDGERIGTYKGHNGAVWTCDITGALFFSFLDCFVFGPLAPALQCGEVLWPPG